jgi:predicted nucleic acid-binding protein
LTASGKTEQETALVLDVLEAVAEPVLVVVRYAPLSQDANDDMVFDVALNGHADAIVTFNTRHFREAAKRFRLLVLTPAELLQEMRRRR